MGLKEHYYRKGIPREILKGIFPNTLKSPKVKGKYPYQRIAESLLTQIKSGRFKSGHRFTIKSLAEQYHVHRETIRLALRKLQKEGVKIQTLHGGDYGGSYLEGLDIQKKPQGQIPPFWKPIYEDFKRRLLSGEFKPGFKLSIRKIADEYQHNATSVYIAFVRLKREGFLETKPHVGTFVKDMKAGKR